MHVVWLGDQLGFSYFILKALHTLKRFDNNPFSSPSTFSIHYFVSYLAARPALTCYLFNKNAGKLQVSKSRQMDATNVDSSTLLIPVIS